MPGGISYNSTSLQTANIITSVIRHHSSADVKLNMAAIAYRNKLVLTNKNLTGKEIVIRGMLDANGDISAMDDLEDTFKGIFIGQDRYLDIEHGSSTRRYIVTPGKANIERDDGLAFAYFTVPFYCSELYGLDITPTELDSTAGYTNATRVISVEFAGNAEYQFPVIEVTLVSGTQLSSGTILIGNNSNGQVLEITANWNEGDVLKIDTANSLVTINNDEVIFSGAIPSFEAGSQGITYEDTFLTRSVDFDIHHYARWQ